MGYKFNVFTGTLDLVGSSSASTDQFLPQYFIDTGDTITVASKREMAIHEELIVEGTLVIEGKLIMVVE